MVAICRPHCQDVLSKEEILFDLFVYLKGNVTEGKSKREREISKHLFTPKVAATSQLNEANAKQKELNLGLPHGLWG